MSGKQMDPALEPLKAKAKELKAQGVPIREIAKVMGLNINRATYYIYGKSKGEARRLKVGAAAVATAKAEAMVGNKRAENVALLSQVAELKKQGYTYTEMSTKLGITKSRAGYLGSRLDKVGVPAASNGHGELPSDLERHVSFAAGHISAWLEVYADSLNVPRRSLSEGVIGVLKARR